MPEPKDDQFLQRRLLIASVLSAVALTVYVYLAPRTPPKAPAEGQTTEQAAPSEKSSETPPTEAPATPSSSPVTPAQSAAAAPAGIAAESEQSIKIETDTFAIVFSNRGAVVTSWTLKHYDDAKGERLDLVYGPAAEKSGYPFSLARIGGDPIASVNKALFVSHREPQGDSLPATLVFEYGDATHTARKSFRFEKDGYLLGVETELTENGRPQEHLITWNSAFGDTDQLQDASHSTTFYYDPVAEKIVRNKAADAHKARIVNGGPFPFAGIEDLFFTATFLPVRPEAPVKLESSAVEITKTEGGTAQVFSTIGVNSDGVGENHLQVFVGPKSVDILRSVRPEMGKIVDFGFWSFVAEPLFGMLRWTHAHVVANWGWSIVALTVFINFVLFPLKWKSMKSMKRMQGLQPLVKQINEKYKGLSMRDPKKAQQNEELMGLYKKHGVNPMGGCLPMVLQLPFFIGFYNVLFVAIEMRHASWLWVGDLSTFESLPIRVLPLAMVATQFWQQSMTPTPSTDAAQMKLMKFMPLMMGFIFYSFSAGLVLFWLTSNLVGVAQQLILNRFASDEPVLDDKSRSRKKKVKSS